MFYINGTSLDIDSIVLRTAMTVINMWSGKEYFVDGLFIETNQKPTMLVDTKLATYKLQTPTVTLYICDRKNDVSFIVAKVLSECKKLIELYNLGEDIFKLVDKSSLSLSFITGQCEVTGASLAVTYENMLLGKSNMHVDISMILIDFYEHFNYEHKFYTQSPTYKQMSIGKYIIGDVIYYSKIYGVHAHIYNHFNECGDILYVHHRRLYDIIEWDSVENKSDTCKCCSMPLYDYVYITTNNKIICGICGHSNKFYTNLKTSKIKGISKHPTSVYEILDIFDSKTKEILTVLLDYQLKKITDDCYVVYDEDEDINYLFASNVHMMDMTTIDIDQTKYFSIIKIQ